ncbi:MAG: cupin domain-containing protein [Clostridia bacterium]|nr:cupin domain-containing protein [Clostridia bacterium]
MIKRSDSFVTELREKMRGGEGVAKLTNFVTNAELNDKGRMFGKIVLEPGCSIGFHVHENDSELFYIMKGTAKYSDNGTEVTVRAGDVTITPKGTGHGIANEGDETVELIALIVF